MGTLAGRRYRVEHRTEYHYGVTMSSGLTVAHLLLRETAMQHVISADINVDPLPEERHTWISHGDQLPFGGSSSQGSSSANAWRASSRCARSRASNASTSDSFTQSTYSLERNGIAPLPTNCRTRTPAAGWRGCCSGWNLRWLTNFHG